MEKLYFFYKFLSIYSFKIQIHSYTARRCSFEAQFPYKLFLGLVHMLKYFKMYKVLEKNSFFEQVHATTSTTSQHIFNMYICMFKIYNHYADTHRL